MMGPPTLVEATAALKESTLDGVIDPVEFHRLMVDDYLAIVRNMRAALSDGASGRIGEAEVEQ